MSKTVLNVKTEKEVKEEAKKVAKELGFPLSTIVNAYLRQLIRSRSVDFSLESDVRPAAKKQLLRAQKDATEGENISGPFETAEKMDEHLDSL